MPRTIQRSVGRNAHNAYDDSKTVQQMLNNVPVEDGGPSPKLEDDGLCGRLTKSAILQFQFHNFSWQGADGRVDPDGATLVALQVHDKPAPTHPPSQPPPAPPVPLPPIGPAIPIPKVEASTEFVFQPAVRRTPFGTEDSDWFFRVRAVPFNDIGIYYFQQTHVVRPLKLPQRFARVWVPANTKHALSPFELGGRAFYQTHDRDGSEHDITRLSILHSTGNIHVKWPVNHLFPFTKGGGGVSQIAQGEFILIRKLTDSDVIW